MHRYMQNAPRTSLTMDKQAKIYVAGHTGLAGSAIQTNVIHKSWRSGVKRLLFLGSSCIYARDCPQPIKEDYLLTGPLEETNKAYALAKIAGVEM